MVLNLMIQLLEMTWITILAVRVVMISCRVEREMITLKETLVTIP